MEKIGGYGVKGNWFIWLIGREMIYKRTEKELFNVVMFFNFARMIGKEVRYVSTGSNRGRLACHTGQKTVRRHVVLDFAKMIGKGACTHRFQEAGLLVIQNRELFDVMLLLTLQS